MGNTLLFALVIVGILAASVFLQYFRTRRAPLGRVLQIFHNIRFAEKLCREFGYTRKVKKFRVAGWEKNKEKVLFLPEKLHRDLANLFGILMDMNVKIDTALKYKSDAYLVSVDVNSLEEPLADCKQQLRTWIQDNIHNPDYQPKRISFLRW